MTIEEMKQRKKELGYSNKTLAEKSGIPIGTLQKIFAGSTLAPRQETIEALVRVLDDTGMYEKGMYEKNLHAQISGVRESSAAYGQKTSDYTQKLYTIEDYIALPEERRVELIDGVFYDMTAPTVNHQGVIGYIYSIFLQHVRKNKGNCFPIVSPVDVQLDMDDKTIVQPDVVIVCDRKKLDGGKRVFGAPDFVLEVLSPSTRKKDMTLKLQKYTNAGVREYWIIDPKKKATVQYDLEHMEIPKVYGPEDEVPVLIWNGECKVDMKEMFDYLSFLM